MSSPELATAVQYDLPIVVLLVNNGMYATIRMHQERQFPGRVIGTDLENPDFPALAQAYGAHGERVERTEDFEAAFERALASGKPSVLELPVDPGADQPARQAERAAEGARMSREEIRVDGLAEPISHFTDAVRAGGFLYVSGIVAGRRRRAGSSAATTSSRRRARSSRTCAPCSPRAGCGFEDVVKVTVFLTDIDDRPLINPVRQEVFGATRPASTLVEVPRLAVAGREGRDRVRRARPMNADPWNAFITRVEPGPAGRGAALGADARRQGSLRHGRASARRTARGSTRTTSPSGTRRPSSASLDAGAVLVGKTHLPEFAWSVLGQSEWYGTCHNPTHPGKTTGGSSRGSAAALAAGLCELALGSDTGCSIRLPSAACEVVGLKSQWGLIPTDGVFPLVPTLDTVGPMARSVEDVALMWSVLTERPVPEPRLAGLTVGLLRQPPGIGDGRETERATPRRRGSPISSGSARASSRRASPSRPRTRGRSSSTRRCSRTRRPSRAAPTSTASSCGRSSSAAQRATPDDVEAAYRAIEEWRRYEPEVDLYVSPCYAVELPPEDADELEVRLPLTSFLRWVNLTGWAGLAIGNMQLVAPRDEVVLAAGLAWERG